VKPFCDEELEDFLIQEPEENCGGLHRLNPARDGDGLRALQWWVRSRIKELIEATLMLCTLRKVPMKPFC
jgi:hypothetical protein